MRTTRKFPASFLALTLLFSLVVTSARADDGPNAAEKERELISILSSDAPAANKAMACKHLAIYGSSAAVPELARLLPNAELASWARIALEAIPGPESDEALRGALDSLQGRLLVGTINSIGVRRDAQAVAALSGRLQDQDPDVASAAAVALGHIGNAAAAETLRAQLAAAPPSVRSAVAEGYVLCAERSLAEGRAAEAVKMYDEVRTADVAKPRILEATRGAILARNEEGIPLLVELFQSADDDLFQIALSTAREIPGRQVDEALAKELVRAAPERASLLLVAMADRKDTVALPAVLAAAERGGKAVRIAAIGALRRVGDASCLSPLLKIALEDDADLAQAAKAALAELPGDNVNADIVARLAKADNKMQPLLIELVGHRRIEALPDLLKAIEHADPAVRRAALTALGTTVPAKSLSVLIKQAVAPRRADDAPVAIAALKAACIRMPDREVCAGEVAAALDRAPATTKAALLDILAAVGGTKALQTIGTAAKSNDAQLQDISSRLLGEWSTIDAAPVLLDLAKTAPGEKYQVRALRGYIRIARQFVMPDEQRAEMCEKALAAAEQAAEQKMVLEVLRRYPSTGTLRLAVKTTQNPELKAEATQVTLTIAQKLGGSGAEVLDLLAKAGIDKVKLEIVKAEYGAGSTQVDVTETLRKQVTDLPLIALPESGYNAVFGGDPAPGIMKKLRIEYRMNGKAGEATFAENELILLPMPK